MLHYSPCQTEKLLLEELPLASLSVLKESTYGEIHSLNVAKLLLEKRSLSSDCVLIIKDIVTEIYVRTAGIYLLKFNNKNTRTRCEICSKLTIKMPENLL